MSSNRTDVTIISASAVFAVLAILAALLNIGQPIQLFATLGAIAFGPGGLAYRLVTGARWGECLIIGLSLNIAALMTLGLMVIIIHFWHPRVELLIPLATCVLVAVLYRRGNRGNQDKRHVNDYQRIRRYQLGRQVTWASSFFWAITGLSISWVAIRISVSCSPWLPSSCSWYSNISA